MHYLSAYTVDHAAAVSCARLAPASCSGKGFSVRPWLRRAMRVVNASAHLLEHGDFTVRPEALVGVANLDEIDVPAWRFLCSACKCTDWSHERRHQSRAGSRLLGRL